MQMETRRKTPQTGEKLTQDTRGEFPARRDSQCKHTRNHLGHHGEVQILPPHMPRKVITSINTLKLTSNHHIGATGHILCKNVPDTLSDTQWPYDSHVWISHC